MGTSSLISFNIQGLSSIFLNRVPIRTHFSFPLTSASFFFISNLLPKLDYIKIWKSNFSPLATQGHWVYSYFEKGCRKKCTWQTQKALWVVLSSLFCKESWKNWYERPWKCVCECYRKATKVGSTGTVVRNSVLIISHITFRDCCVHIVPTPFLEIAVYSWTSHKGTYRKWSFTRIEPQGGLFQEKVQTQLYYMQLRSCYMCSSMLLLKVLLTY